MESTLTEKSRLILEAMAKGHTYEQILVQDLAWTYHDIFGAVQEALHLLDLQPRGTTYQERMDEIHQSHPRAYAPWTNEEDAQLTELLRSKKDIRTMAEILQRQPSAIRSRLKKLNLTH